MALCLSAVKNSQCLCMLAHSRGGFFFLLVLLDDCVVGESEGGFGWMGLTVPSGLWYAAFDFHVSASSGIYI
jgi:hypothetical protein